MYARLKSLYNMIRPQFASLQLCMSIRLLQIRTRMRMAIIITGVSPRARLNHHIYTFTCFLPFNSDLEINNKINTLKLMIGWAKYSDDPLGLAGFAGNRVKIMISLCGRSLEEVDLVSDMVVYILTSIKKTLEACENQ